MNLNIVHDKANRVNLFAYQDIERVISHVIIATAQRNVARLQLCAKLDAYHGPGWRRFGNWLLLGSPLTLVLVVLFFLTFDPAAAGAGLGVAGLTQRILALEVLAWFVAMCWLAFRRSKPAAHRPHPDGLDARPDAGG